MSRISNLSSERGAVLVQTAIAALVLLGFGTFVIDYGVLWVARHQAQNAADAGALAGAVARAYDDFDDTFDPGGVAAQYASQVAGTNLVWGASSPSMAVVPSFTCPLGFFRCVRVDVYRNGEYGSTPLPTWFAPALGLPATQGVRATATAQVLVANSTNCLRPWAIPDKWIEGAPGADFKKYSAAGALLSPHDDYNAPNSSSPGSGLTFPTSNAVPADLGLLVPITLDDLTNPVNPIYSGSLVSLELAGGYAASVAACNGQSIAIEDQLTLSATAPSVGDFTALFDQDPGASWNPLTRTIDGSCAPVCAPRSPRLVAVAVFDVDMFQFRRAVSDWLMCPGGVACSPCPGGVPCVSVVNIVGFFIGDSTGTSGYLTSYPGLLSTDPTELPALTPASSFLKAVTLVR